MVPQKTAFPPRDAAAPREQPEQYRLIGVWRSDGQGSKGAWEEGFVQLGGYGITPEHTARAELEAFRWVQDLGEAFG